MQATLRLQHRASYGEYLAVEQASEHRHELIDGVIVAMAGGSDEHNAIAGRFAVLLGRSLPDPCRYFTPDQRFWIAATARGRYSDGSIICGKPEHPPHDGQASTNPVVVLEVLSPSSEGDDQGDKRLDFQSLASLQAYVITSQDRRRVEVYRRADSGEWPSRPTVYVEGDAFTLPTPDAELAVDEIYRGILDAEGRSLLR
ncbi:MAG: Uma2 family endonuclease [Polyangiaceae bacterium]